MDTVCSYPLVCFSGLITSCRLHNVIYTTCINEHALFLPDAGLHLAFSITLVRDMQTELIDMILALIGWLYWGLTPL